MKIEIKDRFNGKVIFSVECESVLKCLEKAILEDANLSDADLSRANLSRANLSRANLSGANLSRAKGVNPFRCTPLLILLDQPKENDLIAYKLTSKLYHSPIAPAYGYMEIQYVIGATTEELDADDNADEQCAKGISVATLDWCMREWREVYKILRGTFKVSDIACIPTSTDGKFRLRRFTPINEVDLKEIGLEQE